LRGEASLPGVRALARRPSRAAAVLGLFAALTIAALVAFPAQDLPVLVEHDLAVIDLSLVLPAVGTAATLAATSHPADSATVGARPASGPSLEYTRRSVDPARQA
jgi:hypothetical protein